MNTTDKQELEAQARELEQRDFIKRKIAELELRIAAMRNELKMLRNQRTNANDNIHV